MFFEANEILIRPDLKELEKVYKEIVSKRLSGETNFSVSIAIENDEDMSVPGVSCVVESEDESTTERLYDELGDVDAVIEMGCGMLQEVFPYKSLRYFFDATDAELYVTLSFNDYEKMNSKK